MSRTVFVAATLIVCITISNLIIVALKLRGKTDRHVRWMIRQACIDSIVAEILTTLLCAYIFTHLDSLFPL